MDECCTCTTSPHNCVGGVKLRTQEEIRSEYQTRATQLGQVPSSKGSQFAPTEFTTKLRSLQL